MSTSMILGIALVSAIFISICMAAVDIFETLIGESRAEQHVLKKINDLRR